MSVTVVIPTYNRAHLVGSAIESVLAQSYRDLDVIVVDDGSTDDTESVVRRFGGRVRYVKQEQRGCSVARNVGIEAATGRFVAFLDSDDRWRQFKLSLEVALFEARPELGLVFTDFVIEKLDGRIYEHGSSRWAGGRLTFPEMQPLDLTPAAGEGANWHARRVQCFVGPMYRQLLDELPILTSSVMVRRSALDSRMRYPAGVNLFEDWTFFALVSRRHPVGYIDVATTVNVGHDEPGRLSRCDAATQARSYLGLLDRVWQDDAAFVAAHGEALQSARGRGLLALARAAVLSGGRPEARRALDEWRRLRLDDRRELASFYALCTAVPGGRQILRNSLRCRTVLRMISGTRRAYQPVNPAA